jgi:hypothetical protein
LRGPGSRKLGRLRRSGYHGGGHYRELKAAAR